MTDHGDPHTRTKDEQLSVYIPSDTQPSREPTTSAREPKAEPTLAEGDQQAPLSLSTPLDQRNEAPLPWRFPARGDTQSRTIKEKHNTSTNPAKHTTSTSQGGNNYINRARTQPVAPVGRKSWKMISPSFRLFRFCGCGIRRRLVLR